MYLKEIFNYIKKEKNLETHTANNLIIALKSEIQETLADCEDNKINMVADAFSGLIKILRNSVWDEMEKRKLNKSKANLDFPEIISKDEFKLIGFQIDGNKVKKVKDEQVFTLHFVLERLSEKLVEQTIKVHLSKQNLELFSFHILKELNEELFDSANILKELMKIACIDEDTGTISFYPISKKDLSYLKGKGFDSYIENHDKKYVDFYII